MTPSSQADSLTHSRDSISETLVALSSIAAGEVLPYFRKPLAIENKREDSAAYDPVTAADRAAEQAIRAEIENRYPNDSIFGEELADKTGDSEYSWVIDPIDGTRAFVCGLPTWATLIGVCKAGQPLLGLMSQPVVGEYFIGGLAKSELYRDGQSVTLKTRIGKDLANCNLFATAPDMFNHQELNAFEALSSQVQMTRFGVDSYAYCALAAGHIDLVVESGLGFYDIAALIPIIESAGGIVTDWNGQAVRGGGRVIAAANDQIHRQALQTLQANIDNS